MARSRHNAPVGPRRQKRMREHGHGISRRGVEKPEARTDWLPGANKAERNDQRKAAAARLSPLLPVGKRLPARGSRQALPRERRCQRSMRPMRRELAGAQEQSAARLRKNAGVSFANRTGAAVTRFRCHSMQFCESGQGKRTWLAHHAISYAPPELDMLRQLSAQRRHAWTHASMSPTCSQFFAQASRSQSGRRYRDVIRRCILRAARR